MPKTARRCPRCAGRLTHRTQPVTFTYRGESFVVDQPGWYCGSCGEGLHEAADIAATEKAFVELKAQVDGVLGPDDVRKIRQRLQLSQRRAGAVLGGGPRAFQKYESGESAVSQPMSNLLRLLAKDPLRLHELEQPRGGRSRAARRPRAAGAHRRPRRFR
jgi:HTH-type transcriptional regulator/antitoxin MqsA